MIRQASRAFVLAPLGEARIPLTVPGNVISLNRGKAHRRNPGSHGDDKTRAS